MAAPEIFSSWDSLEGVPEWPEATQARPIPAPKAPVAGGVGYRALAWAGERVAGFALAALLAVAADAAARWIGHTLLGYAISPLSGVPIAILLGVALCNGAGVPALFLPGLRFCMRPLQRFAIALLGFRLSLGAVGVIGVHALPVVAVTITLALLLIPWLGARVGISRRLGTLIGVGTSICGVSAIMAVAPAIGAEEEEVSYAVACITIFGMLAMLCYPYLVPLLFGGNIAATGIFFGTAIHDTAQVTGAALSYQELHHAEDVLNIATVVKIIRNLSMALVIPLMAAIFHRQGRAAETGAGKGGRQPLVPLFVAGFLALTLLRTLGDASPRAFGLLDHGAWTAFLHAMDWASTWFLTVVMAAVGLSTSLGQLRRLGIRPFLVGLSAAVLVAVASFGLIRLKSLLGF